MELGVRVARHIGLSSEGATSDTAPRGAQRFQHVLVVGGTGMLRRASALLGARATTLTSVARTRDSLDRLDRELAPTACIHRMVAADWSEPQAFLSSVAAAVAGEPSHPELVVAWLHDDSLGRELFRVLQSLGEPSRFFHVLGSAAGEPGRPLADTTSSHADYHEVILGFERDAREQSRWLTHDEISQGTLEAIGRGAPRYVVGRIRPWAARP